jgi:hypothetical protein
MAIINKITRGNYTPNPLQDTPFPVYAKEYNVLVDQVNAAGLGKLTTPNITVTPIASSIIINEASGKFNVTVVATAGLATRSITVNNSLITANSIVMASISDYAGNGKPLIGDVSPAAGSVVIEIYNAHATDALSAGYGISFVVLG